MLAQEDTSSLTFHSSSLKLDSTHITVRNGDSSDDITVEKTVIDTKFDLVTLHLASKIVSGSRAQVKIGFRGSLGYGQGYCCAKLQLGDKLQYYSYTQFAVCPGHCQCAIVTDCPR